MSRRCCLSVCICVGPEIDLETCPGWTLALASHVCCQLGHGPASCEADRMSGLTIDGQACEMLYCSSSSILYNYKLRLWFKKKIGNIQQLYFLKGEEKRN